MVLEPDGSPAPISPVFGNELFGGGFGITPNADGSQIYIGNFGWGTEEYMPEYGSISVFDSDGNASGMSCYQPLMRMTCNVIDKVGNLWATNNWKPDFPNDVTDNPGGDGVVIFVGVAKPKTL